LTIDPVLVYSHCEVADWPWIPFSFRSHCELADWPWISGSRCCRGLHSRSGAVPRFRIGRGSQGGALTMDSVPILWSRIDNGFRSHYKVSHWLGISGSRIDHVFHSHSKVSHWPGFSGLCIDCGSRSRVAIVDSVPILQCRIGRGSPGRTLTMDVRVPGNHGYKGPGAVMGSLPDMAPFQGVALTMEGEGDTFAYHRTSSQWNWVKRRMQGLSRTHS
jgi:hypothetical protein